MSKMKEKLKNLSLVKRAELVLAVLLSVCFMISVPVYGWFTSQRKAAELYKIEYPNSLYINSAHREDRMYFALDEIDVNELVVDANNEPVIVDGQYQFVEEKLCVFTVSGEGTSGYTLQIAHTNNNHFVYELYEATELAPAQAAQADVVYDMHSGGTVENDLDFSDDIQDSARVAGGKAYYKMGAAIPLTPLNVVDPSDTTVAIRNSANKYYVRTYGDNENVHMDSVPTYLQTSILLSRSDIDANHKRFCKYYILKVTWPDNATNNKETDFVYIGVKRNNRSVS